jgi:pimeloyl-ACP methyl ester carboxylesterase
MIAGDPWQQAALDLGEIMDALGLDRVVLLPRTAAMVGITAAAMLGTRISGGVLVGPEPPAAFDTRWAGMMGRGKSLFFGSPLFAAAFAAILSRRTSSAQIARMQRDSVAGSAIDEAVMDDPHAAADIVRASRQAALGLDGFLAEMRAQGSPGLQPALADGKRWTVIVGAHDPLYDGPASAAHWQAQLPGAQAVIIPDGGRWLHFTHVPAIVAALARLA